MKHLNSMERACLVLAALLVVSGVFLAIWPSEGYVIHPDSAFPAGNGGASQYVTKSGTRVAGIVSVVIGAGFAWMVFYRPRA